MSGIDTIVYMAIGVAIAIGMFFGWTSRGVIERWRARRLRRG